jgi:hypothetical protein
MTVRIERTTYRWLAAVSAFSAAGTLFLPGVLHGTAAMNGSARGTALVLLVVGVALCTVVLGGFVRRLQPTAAESLRKNAQRDGGQQAGPERRVGR